MSEVSKEGSGESVTGYDSELISIDWSFPDADTQYLTHGIHPYPARMVPQIADRILSYFIEEGDINRGDWVYDPFSGSGTTGVEARRHGLHSILVDINPLACMISHVKSNPPNPERISQAKISLYEGGVANESIAGIIPKITSDTCFSIDLDSKYEWFPEPQLSQLGYLRSRIDRLKRDFDERIVRFFRLALSETSRRASYQRNDEFKRYRISEAERKQFEPDVWAIFQDVVERNLNMVTDFWHSTDSRLSTQVIQTDARMPSEIENNEADVIITSPPYGDHKTTVAYGQFSTDPAIISNGEDPDTMRQVDKDGLGGNGEYMVASEKLREKSTTLDSTLEILEDKNGRDEDALKFFIDYYETIKQNKRILKPGQPIVLVVANRTMSRVNIPTHQITLELFKYLNFDVENVLPRSIPIKTLPFENNPGGISDETGDLMANEYILIMRSN